jgi:TolB protein
VIAPDGEHIYLSANDGPVYRAPLAGGRAGRITNTDRPERMHYLHGVSPDGELLAPDVGCRSRRRERQGARQKRS